MVSLTPQARDGPYDSHGDYTYHYQRGGWPSAIETLVHIWAALPILLTCVSLTRLIHRRRGLGELMYTAPSAIGRMPCVPVRRIAAALY